MPHDFTLRKLNPALILAFIIAAYLFGCIYVYDFRIDDSYISLRYAKNLVEHGTLAINPGQPAEEGYSNFLLVLIEALFLKLGVQKVLLIPRLVGILSGVLGIWMTYKISDRIMGDEMRVLSYLPSLALAVSAPYIVWSIGGLETVLFVFLVLAGAYYYILSIDTGELKHCLLSDFFNFMAILCRPEGILFWVLGYLYIIFLRKKPVLGQRFKSFLLSSIFIAGYFLWKYFYFGDFLPLTFYAKYNSMSISLLLGGMLRYVMFLKVNLNFLYFLLFLFAIPASIKNRSYPMIYLIVLLVIYSVYLISLGPTVFMDHVYRMFVPMIPLLYIVGTYGYHQLIKTMPKYQYTMKHGLLGLIVIAQLAAGGYKIYYVWNVDFEWEELPLPMSVYVERYSDWEEIGKWIKNIVPPGSKVAIGDLGAVAYFSDLKIIDTWSLTDKKLVQLRREQLKYVAGSPESNELGRKMAEYVLDQKPEVIFLNYVDIRLDPRVKEYMTLNKPFENVYDIAIRKDLID